MRRARSRVEQLVRTEYLELPRLETALVIAVETANTGTRDGHALLVDWGADQRVEFRNDALGGLDDL